MNVYRTGILRGLVLLALLAGSSRAAERRVDVATPELSGTWVTPDVAWDGRAVVLMHGFADDGDGAGNLLKTLASALAERGIASLRVNFRGEGDRLRTDIRSTFTLRLADGVAAVAWVRARPGVASERLGALGWSLGAFTALETAARQKTAFRSIAVWSSPPGGDAFEFMRGGAMKAAAEAALRTGAGTLEIPGWKTVTLQREFFESFRGVDLEHSLAAYPGAFLTVRGSEDYLPQADAALLKIAKGRPAEAVLIGGADHIFNVFAPTGGEAARAVEVTVAWFVRTL